MKSKNKKRKILGTIKEALKGIEEGFKAKSVSAIEFELKELENVFCLLLMGSFAGIPAPPAFLSLTLLPHMEREIKIMLAKSEKIDDPLGNLFSVFDVG